MTKTRLIMGWIKTIEKFPEDGQRVLIIRNDGIHSAIFDNYSEDLSVVRNFYSTFDKGCGKGLIADKYDIPVYWMPIPKMPQIEVEMAIKEVCE